MGKRRGFWLLLVFSVTVFIAFIWTIGELYELVPADGSVLQEASGIALASVNSELSSLHYSPERSSQRLKVDHLLQLKRGVNTQPGEVNGKSYSGIAKQLGCLQQKSLLLDSPIFEHAECQRNIEESADSGTASQQPELTEQKQYAGQVYLTFDDGPSKLTEPILDLLAESHIEATFFVLGEKVKQYPELAQRIVKEGHSIGNHSYNHRYQELYQQPSVFVDQVLDTAQVIYETTGEVPYLFRAPGGTYGNFDSSYLKAVEAAGYTVFDWNVDSGDSRSRDVKAEEILTTIKSTTISERMIVLLHDSATHEETLAALPDIINYFQELDYQFLAINKETVSLTSRLAKSIKWERKALNEKEAKRLKEQMEKLREQTAS